MAGPPEIASILGTLQAWWGLPLHYQPRPVSSATWYLQVVGSQDGPFLLERTPTLK